ncbi:MAG: transcriptional regulator [Clostridia bacterium]|nr:transcriptional regulator [Clostridia bacterium]
MMKLLLAVINRSDAPTVSGALTKAGYPSTLTNSTGGFFNRDNCVLFAGVDDNRVQSVLKIIKDNTKSCIESVPKDVSIGNFKLPSQIKIGGAVVFVMDVEQFARL